MQNVSKNNVSYFEAGFKAAMAIFGNVSPEEVRRRFYSTTTYQSLARRLLQDYDSREDDTSGTEAMMENL